MTRPAGRDTGYVGRFPLDIEVAGRPLQISVHLAMVGGRMTCVGLDIRSFVAPVPKGVDRDAYRPVGDEWVEITSPLVRAVRVGEAIERAFHASRENIKRVLDAVFPAPRSDPRARQDADAFGEQLMGPLFTPAPAKRRGPKPTLDESALRDVVAPAYLMAARKPVQAVREALDRSGVLPGAGPDGRVTIDQARKAVATARARGFIPPAKKRGRRDEESAR